MASKGKNNLWRGAQYLADETKYRLFITTYAAMRIIDDAVDVGFLGKTAEDRSATRQETIHAVERWLRQAESAAAGGFVTKSDSMEPLVFEALNEYLSRSEIGVEPWRLLAESMRKDVNEEKLGTWEDFLSYCEGATVAPASIFIYILACGVEEDRHTRLRLPQPSKSYARDMALFCYLVHILRDLQDDAKSNRQLLTIPNDLLNETHLNIEEVVDALLSGRWNKLAPITRFLVDKAEFYASRAEAMLVGLVPLLPSREHGILSNLYQWYLDTFRTATKRYLGRAPAV